MKLSAAKSDPYLRTGWFGLIFALLAWNLGCSPVSQPTAIPALTHTPHPPTVTYTPSPEPSQTPTKTKFPPTPSSSPTRTSLVYSPLAGFDISELPDTIHNPYKSPRLGSDDPHQGEDYYDLDPDLGIALEGRTVQTVLAGTITANIQDRFPYGNALIIETHLDQIPSDWTASLPVPDMENSWGYSITLTCPQSSTEIHFPGKTELSLYVLYAHLQSPSQQSVGNWIEAGETIGQIGNSGNSLNPHLHLETRIGPRGFQFESMGHYDSQATQADMYNYCLWRVSGLFLSFRPSEIFESLP